MPNMQEFTEEIIQGIENGETRSKILRKIQKKFCSFQAEIFKSKNSVYHLNKLFARLMRYDKDIAHGLILFGHFDDFLKKEKKAKIEYILFVNICSCFFLKRDYENIIKWGELHVRKLESIIYPRLKGFKKMGSEKKKPISDFLRVLVNLYKILGDTLRVTNRSIEVVASGRKFKLNYLTFLEKFKKMKRKYLGDCTPEIKKLYRNQSVRIFGESERSKKLIKRATLEPDFSKKRKDNTNIERSKAGNSFSSTSSRTFTTAKRLFLSKANNNDRNSGIKDFTSQTSQFSDKDFRLKNKKFFRRKDVKLTSINSMVKSRKFMSKEKGKKISRESSGKQSKKIRSMFTKDYRYKKRRGRPSKRQDRQIDIKEALKGLVTVSINPYISIGGNNDYPAIPKIHEAFISMNSTKNIPLVSNNFQARQKIERAEERGGNSQPQSLEDLYSKLMLLGNQVRNKIKRSRKDSGNMESRKDFAIPVSFSRRNFPNSPTMFNNFENDHESEFFDQQNTFRFKEENNTIVPESTRGGNRGFNRPINDSLVIADSMANSSGMDKIISTGVNTAQRPVNLKKSKFSRIDQLRKENLKRKTTSMKKITINQSEFFDNPNNTVSKSKESKSVNFENDSREFSLKNSEAKSQGNASYFKRNKSHLIATAGKKSSGEGSEERSKKEREMMEETLHEVNKEKKKGKFVKRNSVLHSGGILSNRITFNPNPKMVIRKSLTQYGHKLEKPRSSLKANNIYNSMLSNSISKPASIFHSQDSKGSQDRSLELHNNNILGALDEDRGRRVVTKKSSFSKEKRSENEMDRSDFILEESNFPEIGIYKRINLESLMVVERDKIISQMIEEYFQDYFRNNHTIKFYSSVIIINNFKFQVKIELIEITSVQKETLQFARFDIVMAESPEEEIHQFGDFTFKSENLLGDRFKFMVSTVKFEWVVPCNWSIKCYHFLPQFLTHHLIPFVDIEAVETDEGSILCTPKVWPTPLEFIPQFQVSFKGNESYYASIHHIVENQIRFIIAPELGNNPDDFAYLREILLDVFLEDDFFDEIFELEEPYDEDVYEEFGEALEEMKANSAKLGKERLGGLLKGFLSDNSNRMLILEQNCNLYEEEERHDEIIGLLKVFKQALEMFNFDNKNFNHNFAIYHKKYEVYVIVHFYEKKKDFENCFYISFAIVDPTQVQMDEQCTVDSDITTKRQLIYKPENTEDLKISIEDVEADFGVKYSYLIQDEKKFIYLCYSKILNLTRFKLKDTYGYLLKKPDGFKTLTYRTFYIRDKYRRQLRMELKGSNEEPLFISVNTFNNTLLESNGLMFAINPHNFKKSPYRRREAAKEASIDQPNLQNKPASEYKEEYYLAHFLNFIGWDMINAYICDLWGSPVIQIYGKTLVFENLDNLFNLGLLTSLNKKIKEESYNCPTI